MKPFSTFSFGVWYLWLKFNFYFNINWKFEKPVTLYFKEEGRRCFWRQYLYLFRKQQLKVFSVADWRLLSVIKSSREKQALPSARGEWDVLHWSEKICISSAAGWSLSGMFEENLYQSEEQQLMLLNNFRERQFIHHKRVKSYF